MVDRAGLLFGTDRKYMPPKKPKYKKGDIVYMVFTRNHQPAIMQVKVSSSNDICDNFEYIVTAVDSQVDPEMHTDISESVLFATIIEAESHAIEVAGMKAASSYKEMKKHLELAEKYKLVLDANREYILRNGR